MNSDGGSLPSGTVTRYSGRLDLRVTSVVERCMGQEGVPSREVSPRPGDSVTARGTAPSEPVKASRRDGPRPATHQGSGLPLGEGRPSRAESWAAMSETIRGRLAELAGEVLEWFAEQDSTGENRPRAVVLAPRRSASQNQGSTPRGARCMC